MRIELKLKQGEVVAFKSKDNRMMPDIKKGQLTYLKPITENSKLKVGDIVHCKVKSRFLTNKIVSIKEDEGIIKYQIGDNKGNIQGWVKRDRIYGIL